MLAQDAPDQHAELGAHVLAEGPVDGDVAPHGLHQLAGDAAQRVVAEDLNGAVVGLQRVVEGQLVLGQPQPFSTGVVFVHVLRQLDQLFDDLRRLNRPVLVPSEGLLQQLGKGPGLDDVLALSGG